METSLHFTTLHFTSLHYTSLHFTSLHYTSLHFTTLHFTTLHFTSLHYTSLHFTSLHFTTLHFTSLHFTSLHFTTLHFTSLHFTSLHFTILHFTSLHSTPLHFTSRKCFFFYPFWKCQDLSNMYWNSHLEKKKIWSDVQPYDTTLKIGTHWVHAPTSSTTILMPVASKKLQVDRQPLPDQCEDWGLGKSQFFLRNPHVSLKGCHGNGLAFPSVFVQSLWLVF